MQAVAHFMEQRGDFAMPERGRHIATATAEVAHQIHQRRLHAVGGVAAVAAIVHPRAATLAFARVQVQIELADQLALRIFQAIEAHIRMPDRRDRA